MAERGESDVHLLLSHYHWDHIHGLPFFSPIYQSSTQLEVFGPAKQRSIYDLLHGQMAAPMFPVPFEALTSQWELNDVRSGDQFRVGAALVTAAKLDHPGGALGYRIEHAGCSVVYATDTEITSPDPALVELAHRADLLIFDSQYTPREYRGDRGPSRIGWGHSTYEIGCAIARAANVRRYALFHHDPQRTDTQVEELEDLACRRFRGSFAAREGQTIELGCMASAARASEVSSEFLTA
jgi:phosphoribosyl 1,2-cyclic phosphodiesterase